MGILAKAKDIAGTVKTRAGDVAGRAGSLAGKAGDVAAKGVDVAASGADKVTGGRFHDRIETVSGRIEHVLDPDGHPGPGRNGSGAPNGR